MVEKNLIFKILLQIHSGKLKDLNVCWLRSQIEDSLGGQLPCMEAAAGKAASKLSCDLVLRLGCQHYYWSLGLLLREH